MSTRVENSCTRGLSGGVYDPFIVQSGIGVAHARFGCKTGDELVYSRHLRRVLRADEGTDVDLLQSGLGQDVEQANLCCDRDVGTLDLQTVAHAFFGMNNLGITHGRLLGVNWET
jgi:hypothetical protein